MWIIKAKSQIINIFILVGTFWNFSLVIVGGLEDNFISLLIKVVSFTNTCDFCHDLKIYVYRFYVHDREIRDLFQRHEVHMGDESSIENL